MKKDIILAGVGGQGILSIAAALDLAALENGLNVKQAEVHGMSQRGGAVQSHLRLSNNTIYSDLIPHRNADLILAIEPLEGLRYLHFLSKEGWLITSSNSYKNITDYPSPEALSAYYEKIPNKIIINAEELAKKAGNIKASNIVMLGAASRFLELPDSSFKQAITSLFSLKGMKLVNINLKAFELGKTETLQFI